MATPERVLIVDCNAVCYAAYYTSGHLEYRQQNTGIIYGFFSQIGHVCKARGIAHVAFCWDSRQSRRKRMYPEYKANRKKDDPELVRSLEQFKRIRTEILPRLGFVNSFHATGFEADDLIASLCNEPGPVENQEFIIMSGDNDLYQLLTPQVSIYKSAKKGIYTRDMFTREFGIAPELWANVKAIAGCNSDNIEGIRGIGERRAIWYLQSVGLPPHAAIDSVEGKRIRQRNIELVKLPLPGTPIFSLDWDALPDFSEWLDLCNELGFHSFLNDSGVWESLFTGTTPKQEGLGRLRF